MSNDTACSARAMFVVGTVALATVIAVPEITGAAKIPSAPTVVILRLLLAKLKIAKI